MFGKFSITCKKCECVMELTTNCRAFSGPISCLNCGQVFSKQDQKALEQAILAIRNLPSETETEPAVIEEKVGFKFALEVTPCYVDFGEPDVL